MSSEDLTSDQKPAEDKPTCGCCCRGGCLKWPFGLIFVGLLFIVAFGPNIASHEPFRSWVLKKVFPGVQGTVTCSDASFGWFSPVVLYDLRIGRSENNEAGKQPSKKIPPVIAVQKIAGNRPLWELLLDKSKPGDFAIEKPAINVVVTDSGSNLDGVFAPRKQQTESQREALKRLTTGIRIDGAELSVAGPRIPHGWKIGPLDAAFEIKDGLLDLEPAVLFDHARLTPRVSQDFLRFVAPILADATTVDGEFSLKLDAWKVPLYAPKKTTGSGLLEINSLDVGAGPLVGEIAKLLRLSPRILVVKDSPVKFYMKDERIHHVDLTFYIEGVKVRTQGSVGLDETLDMMVDIPVPKHLLGDGPLATALAKQTVQIPIGGTLAKPQIDSTRLGGSIQSLVRGTVKSMAKDDVSQAEGFLKGLIDRATVAKPAPGDKSEDKPGDKKAETEALIGDIIGGASSLLEERRKRRAAGEPTLLDRLRKQRQPQSKNGAEKPRP